MSGRNLSLCCTLTLITMQVHQNRAKKKYTMNLSITNLYYIDFGIGLDFKEKHTKLDSNITQTTNILYTFFSGDHVRRRNRDTVDDTVYV